MCRILGRRRLRRSINHSRRILPDDGKRVANLSTTGWDPADIVGGNTMYLKYNAPKSRLRDAEDARKNRAEIVKAISTGQITRRQLMKMGIFSGAGLLLPIGGLNPFVGTARADGVPTGTPPSPMLPGSKPAVVGKS